jgi:hypothetical protein
MRELETARAAVYLTGKVRIDDGQRTSWVAKSPQMASFSKELESFLDSKMTIQ